jgi:hypothetical protein
LQISFIELSRILILLYPRKLPSVVYEATCNLMATTLDIGVYFSARTVVSGAFHRGHLSAQQLLEHLFPGLIRAFKDEAVRRAPLHSKTEKELEYLGHMLAFLFLAFRRTFVAPTNRLHGLLAQGDAAEGTELLMEYLPTLAWLMVEHELPAVLMTLFGTVFDERVHHLILTIVAAGAPTPDDVKRSLAVTIAPPLLATLGMGEPGVNSLRSRILGFLLGTYRKDLPSKFLGHIEGGREVVVYDWDRNESTSYGRQNVLRERAFMDWLRQEETGRNGGQSEVRSEERSPPQPDGILLSGGQLSSSRTPGGKCQKCKQSMSAPKRCSGCQGVVYCSVACQKRDWKSHRAICRKTGTAS